MFGFRLSAAPFKNKIAGLPPSAATSGCVVSCEGSLCGASPFWAYFHPDLGNIRLCRVLGIPEGSNESNVDPILI